MINGIFLGTSSQKPTKDRNHSGVLIQFKGGNILFDCGEGIQRQLRVARLKPSKITRICISHWHGDHVLGLPGLLSTMETDQYSKKLHIYGPKGSKKYVSYMKKTFFSHGLIDFVVHEVENGIVVDETDFKIVARPLRHNTTCLGYSFIEKDRLRIKVAAAKRLGLAGPILGKLQQGKNVTHNGKKINFKDITYKVKGKKLTYLPDTRPCANALKLAMKSDLMIMESSYHSDDSKIAKEHHHMTAREVGAIAKKADVKKLILTHPSSRYKDVSVLVKNAKKEFRSVSFAKDFMKFEV